MTPAQPRLSLTGSAPRAVMMAKRWARLFGALAAALAGAAVASSVAAAKPAILGGSAAAQSPKPSASNTFQEYQFACPGGNPFTTQETCNFTPTPAGKFAKIQNASCLIQVVNTRLKYIQLLVLEGDVVKSALTLNHVVTYADQLETWVSSHDRITAYAAAGQRVQIKATLFELPTNGDTNLVCHISGTY